jgi:DNA-binding transcriptional ArsR family regulator
MNTQTDNCEDQHIHPEAVQAAQAQMIGPADTLKLAELFKILGEPTRVRLLSALLHSELCVYDLAAVLGMNQSAVSHQLRHLRAAGLVKYRKDGKHAYYQLDDEHVEQLFACGLEHILHQKIS